MPAAPVPAPVIRPRSAADLPGCVDTLTGVYEAERYPTRWPEDPARWLRPAGLLGAWVAVDGPALLGHVLLTGTEPQLAAAVGLPAGQLATVGRLFVGVEARRRGLARLLLDTARSAAADRGLRAVLEVAVWADAAAALYEQAGWRFVSRATATWTTADGRPAEVATYLAPATS